MNNNYEEFLSLGSDLKGGEEKVEGVRVGLLGFEREVEGIRNVVAERVGEVSSLLEERKKVRRDVVLGRGLLEVERGIEELEERLGIKNDYAGQGFDSEDDDGQSNGVDSSIPVRKLHRHTQQYLLLSRSIARLGSEHPFLQAQRSRMAELRRTLLLDLGAALKQAKAAKAQEATLALVRIYADLGAEQDGVKALKAG